MLRSDIRSYSPVPVIKLALPTQTYETQLRFSAVNLRSGSYPDRISGNDKDIVQALYVWSSD